ncbi:MAG: hypothetical protein AAF518_14505 [Spirochaetota bacterium]
MWEKVNDYLYKHKPNGNDTKTYLEKNLSNGEWYIFDGDNIDIRVPIGGLFNNPVFFSEQRLNPTTQIEAKESIAAFSLVSRDGYVVKSDDVTQRYKIVGIVASPVATGQAAEVSLSGIVVNPAWNFENGKSVFLNGTTLSSAPPNSGFCCTIGRSVTATAIFLNIQNPILL